MIALERDWTGQVEPFVGLLPTNDWEEAKEECQRRLAATRPRTAITDNELVWARAYLLEIFPDNREEIDSTLTPQEISDMALELADLL